MTRTTLADIADASVAAAYEAAANIVERAGHSLHVELRALTPADAKAALEAVRREAERAGYERGVSNAIEKFQTLAKNQIAMERECSVCADNGPASADKFSWDHGRDHMARVARGSMEAVAYHTNLALLNNLTQEDDA